MPLNNAALDVIRALEQERCRRDVTRADLARAAGLTKATVTRILNGEQEPKLNAVASMTRALGAEVMIIPGVRRADPPSRRRATRTP